MEVAMNNVSFHGRNIEPVDKDANQIDSSKCETCGSIGYRAFENGSIPNIDRTLGNDTINFRGCSGYQTKDSHVGRNLFWGIVSLIAFTVGCGYAHKTNAVSKISNPTVKSWFKHADKITKPCYDFWAKAQNFSVNNYHKLVKR